MERDGIQMHLLAWEGLLGGGEIWKCSSLLQLVMITDEMR